MTQIKLSELSSIALGLNIEGCRPTLSLPDGCKWYNLIQVIDTPLAGTTFDKVMASVKNNNYSLIEQAVNIDIDKFIDQLSNLVKEISVHHKNLLVHVHQYTGTTILDRLIYEKTGIKTILDTTNFFETPTNYAKDYPDIDGLVSISQCAGFGLKEGSWIVPDNFFEFNVHTNKIYDKALPSKASNDVQKFIKFEHEIGNILVVNDLWNPTDEDILNDIEIKIEKK